MAILSRCCFVCSVRDGTLVIGITCIVCRVLASVACVVLLASYAHEHGAEPGGTLRYNMTSLKLLLPDNLLVVLFSGFLVIGLVKNRRYYLIPWIVWVSASCIILIILWCLRAIIAIKDQKDVEDGEPLPASTAGWRLVSGPWKRMEQRRLLPSRGPEESLQHHCAWARRTPEASVTLPPTASHRRNFFAEGMIAAFWLQRTKFFLLQLEQ
ncbi:uncharacterized protein LOC142576737 isoform X2 [Dermacentor variabilis]|uniref:uncharacterized protein LOC142576737 isoform X2 n=1 Tax=Dermacentor variabilis TaxID=34621 RepID=UPI003F5B4218